MNKSNELASTIGKMLNICRNAGVPDFDGATLIAQIFAWASLSLTKLESQLNFFSYDVELTAEGWEYILQRLRAKSDRYALAFTLTDNFRKEVSPGLLEKLKTLTASIDLKREQDRAEVQKILTQLIVDAMKREAILDEVRDLIIELIVPTPDSSIYCPFPGSAKLALALSGVSKSISFECQEPLVCQIVALLDILGSDANSIQEGDRIDISVSDPILNPQWASQDELTQFDCSISVPPLGQRYQEEIFDPYQRFPPKCLFGEVLQLAHILAQTKERAAVLVPAGFLFRTAKAEQAFKQHLLQQGWLQAVVGLPGGILAPYTNIATALLLFDKTALEKETDPRQKGVVFVDASVEKFIQPATTRRKRSSLKLEAIEEIVALVRDRQNGSHSQVATIEQIAEQDFNLSVDRYVLSAEDKLVRQLVEVNKTIELEAMAQIYRPQVVPDGGKEPFHTFKEVALTDIQASGLITTPSKNVFVSTQNLAQVRKQQIESGDILISVKGRVGAIGLVKSNDEGSLEQFSDCIAGQSFAIVRLRDSSPIKDPFVLFRYLISPLGQKLLQFYSQGVTVPLIQMGELRKLPIVVPSGEEQQKIIRNCQAALELHQKIADTERQIKELDANVWPMSLTGSALKN